MNRGHIFRYKYDGKQIEKMLIAVMKEPKLEIKHKRLFGNGFGQVDYLEKRGIYVAFRCSCS